MGTFDGKVAIVTGAGRGIGRGEAMLLAAGGAKVVVNDLGVAREGDTGDDSPAQEVVDEITAAGGTAMVSGHDVSSWTGAQELIATAVDAYGTLDILVNNAGILRDAMSFNMSEDDWDAVIRVHLKGHFAPSRFAVLLLARAVEGARRRAGGRSDHQHRQRVRAVRHGRAGELLRGQGRHRVDDARARPGDEEVRRDRQRGRPSSAHAHDRDRRRRRRVHGREGG